MAYYNSYYGSPPKTGGGYLPPSSYAPPVQRQAPISSYAGYAASGATPPASTAQSTPAAQAGPSLPDLSHLDYSNDPILARIRALGQQSISDANAEALRQRQQLAIGYGDPALAQTLGLGKGIGKQAGNNPFGTVQELGRTYKRRDVFDINRPLSDQANLFYSSERGRQLALSGEQNLRDQAQARNAVQDRLAAISQQVLQAKLAAQAQTIQGEQEAYQRALQMALYSAAGTG